MTKPSATTLFRRAAVSGLRRLDMLLLAGLCLATLLYGVGNLSLRPAKLDGLHNLKMGIWLGQEPDRAGYLREPFVPAVIAAITLAQRALGHEPATPDCADRHGGQVETFGCRAAYAPYKTLNVVSVLVAGIGVFFLCRRFSKARWLPHVAFVLVTQSLLAMGWRDQTTDTFLTEAPAAALVVTVSCLGVLALDRRRVLWSVLLGLALAALVLTKVVFLWFWPFVVAGLILADALQGTFGRRTALLVGAFLVAHSLPVGGWMARNFVLFDELSVVASKRATAVQNLRAAYNTMRDDELAAGFWYYLPHKFGIDVPKRSWERFVHNDVNGFRQMGFDRKAAQRKIAPRAAEKETSLSRMFAEPWRRLKISALMAWRGLFVQNRLGYANPFPRIHLLHHVPLPWELRPSLKAMVSGAYGNGKEVYVAWFRGRGAVEGYDEAELKAFLNLETVAELADATLYRVPPPDDFAIRIRVSEFLGSGDGHAARWSNPSGMLHRFRDAAYGSMVLTNHGSSLPGFQVSLPRLAEVWWGLDSWPRWGWWFSFPVRTAVNLVGGLALLVVPLWFWLGRRRRMDVMVAMLPALYIHVVYAVVSHFRPRYAYPEVPLRILATLLLVCLVASSVRDWAENRPKRRRPPRRGNDVGTAVSGTGVATPSAPPAGRGQT